MLPFRSQQTSKGNLMLVPVVPLLPMLAGQAPPPQAAPAPSRPPQQAPPKLYNETADARAQVDAALKAAAESDIGSSSTGAPTTTRRARHSGGT